MIGKILLIWLFACPCILSAETNGETKRYPPYPDIWDWSVPDTEAYISPWLHAHLLDNGDVLILYSMQDDTARKPEKETLSNPTAVDKKLAGLVSKATGKPEQAQGELVLGQITLFGKQTIVSQPSNVRIMRNEDQPIQLSDGSVARIVASNDDSISRHLPLTDGSIITSAHTHPLKDCFLGPAKAWFIRKTEIPKPNQSPPKVLARKIIFRLLDKPKTWEGAYYENCDESEHRLIVRAEPMQGTILPLNDGTFLVVSSSAGLIIRFDKDFQTRSPLLNRKFFVFDQDEHTDGIFIDKITGKQYWEEKDGQTYSKNQEALDDLYNYLISIKRKYNQ